MPKEVKEREEKKEARPLSRVEQAFRVIVYVLIGAIIGATIVKLSYNVVSLPNPVNCDQLVLTPDKNTPNLDLNIQLCEQYVPNLPGYIFLCPTPFGVTFGLSPELNAEVAYAMYSQCQKVQQDIIPQMIEQNNMGEVNGQ